MRFSIVQIVALSLLLTPALSVGEDTLARRVNGYIVGYGIYKAGTNGYGRERIIKETNSVPATIGSDFGIRYVIKAGTGRLVLLRYTWSRPKPGAEDGEREEFEFFTLIGPGSFGRLRNEHVLLHSKEDVIPGTWSVRIHAMAFCSILNSENCDNFEQEKLIVEKDFFLYDPTAGESG